MVHNTVFEGKGSQIKALCKLKVKYSQVTVVVPVGESDGGPGTAGLTFSEGTSFHSRDYTRRQGGHFMGRMGILHVRHSLI